MTVSCPTGLNIAPVRRAAAAIKSEQGLFKVSPYCISINVLIESCITIFP